MDVLRHEFKKFFTGVLLHPGENLKTSINRMSQTKAAESIGAIIGFAEKAVSVSTVALKNVWNSFSKAFSSFEFWRYILSLKCGRKLFPSQGVLFPVSA